jgi:hypothetical protein
VVESELRNLRFNFLNVDENRCENLQLDTGKNCQTCARVVKVVKSNVWHVCLFHNAFVRRPSVCRSPVRRLPVFCVCPLSKRKMFCPSTKF